MSETKTETPLEHFGAWTRTAESDGIGKGGTVLANDLIDLYEIVGSEYCRAQGLDFNDDVYHGDHEGIIQWACCTACLPQKTPLQCTQRPHFVGKQSFFRTFAPLPQVLFSLQ